MDTRKLSKIASTCGGCVAKLPQGLLQDVLQSIPRFESDQLLVGFESSDDAAVYRLTEDLAIVHTTDFFPPMVDDPYLFGKIAATNALSDVWAMGGRVLTALNLVAFPGGEDPLVLAEILRGGAEKVKEAGGVLCGGHSIEDATPKYGLSVTGQVHPERIWRNNTCQMGDQIILTKPLGVGMVTAAYGLGQVSEESFTQAVESMQTLNKYAAEMAQEFRIHACTDVTGFGFLGHLNEMVTADYSIHVAAEQVPYIPEARRLAAEFLITGGGMKNRAFLADKVALQGLDQATEEILFDPQTSGGLLFAVHPGDAAALLEALGGLSLPAAIVGEVRGRGEHNVVVSGGW
ncbi:MAG: selenide, water dikinase SelD [Oscillospiraceae bacterium]|nr:selenide, water dikinase SelD [Oscillospiraceae bacterium]